MRSKKLPAEHRDQNNLFLTDLCITHSRLYGLQNMLSFSLKPPGGS